MIEYNNVFKRFIDMFFMSEYELSADAEVIMKIAEEVAWGRHHDRLDTLHVISVLTRAAGPCIPYVRYLSDKGVTENRVTQGLSLFHREWQGDCDGDLPHTCGLNTCLRAADNYREARGGESVDVVDLVCGLITQGAYLGKDVDLGDKKAKEAVARELQAIHVFRNNPNLEEYLKP